jgi:hypothetical protein
MEIDSVSQMRNNHLCLCLSVRFSELAQVKFPDQQRKGKRRPASDDTDFHGSHAVVRCSAGGAGCAICVHPRTGSVRIDFMRPIIRPRCPGRQMLVLHSGRAAAPIVRPERSRISESPAADRRQDGTHRRRCTTTAAALTDVGGGRRARVPYPRAKTFSMSVQRLSVILRHFRSLIRGSQNLKWSMDVGGSATPNG